jgi:hypothetical protein
VISRQEPDAHQPGAPSRGKIQNIPDHVGHGFLLPADTRLGCAHLIDLRTGTSWPDFVFFREEKPPGGFCSLTVQSRTVRSRKNISFRFRRCTGDRFASARQAAMTPRPATVTAVD